MTDRIDTSPLAEIFEKCAEKLREEFSDESFVRTVALVVETDHGSNTTYHIEVSDDRNWARIAFLDLAIRVLENLEFDRQEHDE